MDVTYRLAINHWVSMTTRYTQSINVELPAASSSQAEIQNTRCGTTETLLNQALKKKASKFCSELKIINGRRDSRAFSAKSWWMSGDCQKSIWAEEFTFFSEIRFHGLGIEMSTYFFPNFRLRFAIW